MPRRTFRFEGKRYDVTAPTEKELIEKIALRKRDLKEGRHRINKNMILRDWIKIYMEIYREPMVGEDTYKNDVSVNKVWIDPNIGAMLLKDIRVAHLQTILNSMQHYTKNYIKKVRIFMNGVFEMAVENELLLTNPAKKLSIPISKDGTHRALTENERRILIEVCDTNKYGLWVLVMYYCGLRPGETERIQGRHIDLKKRILYVDGTKTAAAKRRRQTNNNGISTFTGTAPTYCPTYGHDNRPNIMQRNHYAVTRFLISQTELSIIVSS